MSAGRVGVSIQGRGVFNVSIVGLGGCPFVPGATGNVSAEGTVYMLRVIGIETGIDLPGLVSTALLAEEILGETLPGQVMKAGRTCDLHRCRLWRNSLTLAETISG